MDIGVTVADGGRGMFLAYRINQGDDVRRVKCQCLLWMMPDGR
jgi:hypothetical protein